jgi:hypothetical protein
VALRQPRSPISCRSPTPTGRLLETDAAVAVCTPEVTDRPTSGRGPFSLKAAPNGRRTVPRLIPTALTWVRVGIPGGVRLTRTDSQSDSDQNLSPLTADQCCTPPKPRSHN